MIRTEDIYWVLADLFGEVLPHTADRVARVANQHVGWVPGGGIYLSEVIVPHARVSGSGLTTTVTTRRVGDLAEVRFATSPFWGEVGGDAKRFGCYVPLDRLDTRHYPITVGAGPLLTPGFLGMFNIHSMDGMTATVAELV